jgi:hypothetical protein
MRAAGWEKIRNYGDGVGGVEKSFTLAILHLQINDVIISNQSILKEL